MYTTSYSSYGSSFGSSLSSKPSLPALPPSPSYSPYSGSSRYNDYSNSKFGNISVYPTPINYSSSLLKRGSSLQDVSSPLGSSTRRLTRHSSLDKEVPSMFQKKRSTALPMGYFEQSYHDHVRSGRSLPRSKPTKEGKKRRPISCNKVFPGIIIGNGETVCDISYLKSLGVTHVLNTAEDHVRVYPTKYASHGIQYYGFHVDDLPHCDISRYFTRTTEFIHSCVAGGGLVVVNCFMGLSRSASCVLAYLMMKQGMSLDTAMATVRQHRAIRPNEGFLQQLRTVERVQRYR